MDTPLTRPTLLARLRRVGDEEAWHHFERQYGGLIVRYCRRCGVLLADAEDICQIVIAKLSRALTAFEYDPRRGRFRDYLGRAVRNAVASYFSSHKNAPGTVSLSRAAQVPDDNDELATTWQEEWTTHHYRLALASLRTQVDERSLAIFDALIEGRAPEAIAADYSASPAAVRKVKQRIRDRLRAIIARQIQDEDP